MLGPGRCWVGLCTVVMVVGYRLKSFSIAVMRKDSVHSLGGRQVKWRADVLCQIVGVVQVTLLGGCLRTRAQVRQESAQEQGQPCSFYDIHPGEN